MRMALDRPRRSRICVKIHEDCIRSFRPKELPVLSVVLLKQFFPSGPYDRATKGSHQVVARVHYPAADLKHLLSTVVVIALDIHHDAGHFCFNDLCVWPRLSRHLVCVTEVRHFMLDLRLRSSGEGL